MNNWKSTIHPGEILADELEEINLDVFQLAKRVIAVCSRMRYTATSYKSVQAILYLYLTQANTAIVRGDLAPLQAAFNSSIGSPKYDPTADINGDGGINLGDFLVLNSDYGLSLF